jgi:NAD(P)H-dependent FMN reductase
MTNIVGISGSLRADSYNSALLRAAGTAMPSGTAFTIATIRGIPVYDGDVETAGFPPAVIQLKEAILGGDGLLIATPEYNNSIPGALKNAVDWLSRLPDQASIFKDRPVAVMGASLGSGTILSQAAWLPILHRLSARTWHGARLMVPGADKVFDAKGTLIDERIRASLQTFVAGFAAFVGEESARSKA